MKGVPRPGRNHRVSRSLFDKIWGPNRCADFNQETLRGGTVSDSRVYPPRTPSSGESESVWQLQRIDHGPADNRLETRNSRNLSFGDFYPWSGES